MEVANIHMTNDHTNYLVWTQFIFSFATIRTMKERMIYTQTYP